MLKKINEGGVESSEGFSVQITGPETIRYSYKNYSIELDISCDAKSRKAYVYASDANYWKNGSSSIVLTQEQKTAMIQNIKEAVKLLTGEFDIV